VSPGFVFINLRFLIEAAFGRCQISVRIILCYCHRCVCFDGFIILLLIKEAMWTMFQMSHGPWRAPVIKEVD
jgi:hypothetical protein